jgi:hypothetical protein
VTTVIDLAGDAPEPDVAQPEGLPPGAKLNSDGTVTLTLRTPVVITTRDHSGREEHETYTELRINELTGKQMKSLIALRTERDQSRIAEFMLAATTGISEKVASVLFDRMRARDIKAFTEVSHFLNEELA